MRPLFLFCLALAACCGPDPVRRPCENPEGASAVGTYIRSPALECPSHLCLVSGSDVVDGGPIAVCAVECNSDADCRQAVTIPHCTTGFVCAFTAYQGGAGGTNVCACSR